MKIALRELCAMITATLEQPRGQTCEHVESDHAQDAGPYRLQIGRTTAGRAVPLRRDPQATGMLRFRHRRKLGDIIYSLPVVRQMGGGVLYLDPTSLDGVQDQAYWRHQFETLIPFLEQQPYLREVRIHQGEAFDVDLDAYLTHDPRDARRSRDDRRQSFHRPGPRSPERILALACRRRPAGDLSDRGPSIAPLSRRRWIIHSS